MLALQALQQLWEPARFTYQVNAPSNQRPSQSQSQAAAKATPKLRADDSESEAGTSSSEEDGDAQQQPVSQAVTTRARAVQGSAPPILPPRYREQLYIRKWCSQACMCQGPAELGSC